MKEPRKCAGVATRKAQPTVAEDERRITLTRTPSGDEIAARLVRIRAPCTAAMETPDKCRTFLNKARGERFPRLIFSGVRGRNSDLIGAPAPDSFPSAHPFSIRVS